jgi:hypothetical protein
MKHLLTVVKANFSKITTFKGTIRKCLNMVAVHMEGSRHPPYAYLKHFFRGSVPLTCFSIGILKQSETVIVPSTILYCTVYCPVIYCCHIRASLIYINHFLVIKNLKTSAIKSQNCRTF